MGVTHIEQEAAIALRHPLLDPKQDGEGVGPAAGPDIGRARVNIGPGGLRLGQPHHEQPILRIAFVGLGRQDELCGVAVIGADLPKGAHLRSRACQGGEQQQEGGP